MAITASNHGTRLVSIPSLFFGAVDDATCFCNAFYPSWCGHARSVPSSGAQVLR